MNLVTALLLLWIFCLPGFEPGSTSGKSPVQERHKTLNQVLTPEDTGVPVRLLLLVT